MPGKNADLHGNYVILCRKILLLQQELYIPKKCIADTSHDELRNLLVKKLGEKFIIKN